MKYDKPLVWIAKCAACGKAKNQHQADSALCPNGKRLVTGGYASYGPGKYR